MNRYQITLCYHKCRGCAVELPHHMIVNADSVEIEHTGRRFSQCMIEVLLRKSDPPKLPNSLQPAKKRGK
jgi:hypothetical protein